MSKYISSKSRRKQLRKLIRQQQISKEKEETEHKPEVREESEAEEIKPEKLHKHPLEGIKAFYDKKYKKLLFIPFTILLIAIIIISVQTITTGDFVKKGVTLKGGTTITFENAPDIDVIGLMDSLNDKFPVLDINVRSLSRAGKQIGIIIDSDAKTTDNINSIVTFVKERLEPAQQDYSIETMGSSLGKSFFKETLIALLIAFCFMGLVVFLYFKTFVPSVAVILAAASDIVVTLAIVNILGIKLSTAGIAAFLMLIGYSVDTDILLSTKLLKRKEGLVIDRLFGAMKTGLTMSLTTLGAVTVALIFSQSDVIRQIMIILLIGLLVDLINTWIQNAGILRLYLEKKKTVKNE